MRSYIELISTWETFLKEHPKGSLNEFAEWILHPSNASPSASDAPNLEAYFDKNTVEFGYSEANSEAAYLIWRLSKFIRRYTKPLFSDLGINNQDEFAILAHVDYLKECSKKCAVEENLIDMSSGIDMISRLIKMGWLSERSNPNDKREKLIRLTPEGTNLLQKIYIDFSSVPDILVNMDNAQRIILVSRLKDLDAIHTKNQV